MSQQNGRPAPRKQKLLPPGDFKAGGGGNGKHTSIGLNDPLHPGGGRQHTRGDNMPHKKPGESLLAYRQRLHEENPSRWPPPPQDLTVHEVITIEQRGPGQPRSMVRRACRVNFADRVPMLCRIADGDEVRLYEQMTITGSIVPIAVTPTIVERLRAMELMGKAGGLFEPPQPGDDGEEDTAKPLLDLKQLTVAELEQLHALMKRARVPSGEVLEES